MIVIQVVPSLTTTGNHQRKHHSITHQTMRPSIVRQGLRANSYYNKYTYQMSPAMLRARQPYFWKNAATFIVLGGISMSVYIYTYTFLMRDDFEDIPIPPVSDEELKQLKKDYEESKKPSSA